MKNETETEKIFWNLNLTASDRFLLGTCECFFFVQIECQIESAIQIVVYTYSEYLILRYFVFVPNESDVWTTELRTEYLFISIQS